jgi:hypothetical protein
MITVLTMMTSALSWCLLDLLLGQIEEALDTLQSLITADC